MNFWQTHKRLAHRDFIKRRLDQPPEGTRSVSAKITMNSYDSDSSSVNEDEILHDTTTEAGMDRWHRLPGEFDLFKGDGRPDSRFLALGDAKLPVFDELTSWMKRSNKPPPDEIFRGRSGFHPEDAEKNYLAAEKRFNMDIPVPGVEADVKDREFYDRWAETLDFR